jgi:hypothetical protein
MVWLSYGWTGLEDFRQERFAATKQIDGFKEGNCFHDGNTRLPVVVTWLAKAVQGSPKCDNISTRLQQLIHEMLDETVQHRPDCMSLYHRTKRIIRDASNTLPGQLGETPPIFPIVTPTRPAPNYPGDTSGSSQSQVPYHSNTISPFFFTPPSSSLEGNMNSWPGPQAGIPYVSVSPSEIDSGKYPSSPLDREISRRSFSSTAVPLKQDGQESFQRYTGPTSLPIGLSIPRAVSTHTTPSNVPLSPTAQRSINGAIAEGGITMGNGTTKPETPIPVWLLKDALEWRRQRKAQKISISDIGKIFRKESDKDKFAEVEGHHHLAELNNRDHVSWQ